MLKLHHGNNLETLLAALLSHIEQPLSHPFAAETILVQSQGMARWLSYHIAEQQGVAANIDYPFPASFVWKVYQETLPDIPDTTGYEKSALIWQVVSLLPHFIEHPAFTSLARYLSDDKSQRKHFQLACKIADIFDQYLVYRPKWMLEWETTDIDYWQAILWKAIASQNPSGNRAQMLHAFLDHAKAGSLNTNTLPERISIFGISALPPMMLDAFAQLSDIIEVNIYLFNPCLSYWGDIRSQRDIARFRSLRQKHGNNANVEYYATGNPLLASMGKLGQDYLELLHNYPHEEYELFSAPQSTELLGSVQADILLLMDRTQPLAASESPDKTLIAPDDVSIQIHVCHSKVREIEALHDQLLNLLSRNPELHPKDIVIMAPGVEEYADTIEAVFSSVSSAQKIPWSIADRSAYTQHGMIQAFFQLLTLPDKRFENSDILSLLEIPCIQQRFNLTEPAIDGIRQWVRESGIRWGLDNEHLQELDLPCNIQNTWQFGLERLLLGYSMPPEDQLFSGIAPFPGIEGQEVANLGLLITFIKQLKTTKQQLQQSYTAQAWEKVINTLLNDYFVEEAEDAFVLIHVRNALEKLKNHTEFAQFEDTLHLEVVKDYLTLLLTQPISDHHFLTGQVTFCSLVPMRSIPFKVICLLGMNDQDFPRQHRPLDFDLMAKQPEKGDRARREDDRYLFLEALVSTRYCFYLSYVGRHIRDNSTLIPSIVVQELLDTIDAGFEGKNGSAVEQITTIHPLQPFSPRYFSEPGLFSYAHEWLPAATAVNQQKIEAASFGAERLSSPEDNFKTIEINQLIRFFKNPMRAFANYRLNIWLNESDEQLESTEPFSLSALERYQINQDLLQEVLQQGSLNDYYTKIRAQGRLPSGHFSQTLFNNLQTPIERFGTPLKAILAQHIAPLDCQLQWGEITLQGWLQTLTPNGLIQYRFAKLTPEDKISLWIMHLILNTLKPSGLELSSTHYGVDYQLTFPPIPNAEILLKDLTNIYWNGLQKPVYFFPKTSHQYMKSRNKEEAEFMLNSNIEKIWQGIPNVRGEKESAYYKTFYRDHEPEFGSQFQQISEHVFKPILEFEKIQKPDLYQNEGK